MRKALPLPPYTYLHECFDYNEITGVLTWKVRPSHHFRSERARKITNTLFSGKQAGNIVVCSGKKYLQVTIDRKLYLVHRICYKMYYNKEPTVIDHGDGNGLHNWILNLSDGTMSDNMKNRRMLECNSTGVTGVSLTKSGIWNAHIMVGYKGYNLYTGLDLFEACCARKSAELLYGFNKNHGKERNL